MKDVHRQREEEKGSYTGQKKQTGYCKVTFFTDQQVYQADCLTADQAIPDEQVLDSTSGRAETVVKSQLGDMGLSISDSIWSLLS